MRTLVETQSVLNVGAMNDHKILTIDFECSNFGRDSAHQVGWATWFGDRREAGSAYIAPDRDFPNPYSPRAEFHERLRRAETFKEIYTSCLRSLIDEADYIVAHNAQFDRSVLKVLCEKFGLEQVDRPWINSIMIARQYFDIRPTRLQNVVEKCGLQSKFQRRWPDRAFKLHDAGTDAAVTQLFFEHAVTKYGWNNVLQLASRVVPREIVGAQTPKSLPERDSAHAVRAGLVTNERRVWTAIAEIYDRETLSDDTGLTREELRAMSQDEAVDVWARSYDSKLSVMLDDQLRQDLQSACRSLDLEDGGYTRTLTQRLLAFAKDEPAVATGQRPRHHDKQRELRVVIASLVTRRYLCDFVGMIESRPPRFYALSRDDLERHFVESWDGDLQDLLNYLYVDTIKDVYQQLEIARPRYRSEMIDDLLHRFG